MSMITTKGTRDTMDMFVLGIFILAMILLGILI